MTAWRQVAINKICEKCKKEFDTCLKFDSIGNYDDDPYEIGQKVMVDIDLECGKKYNAWVDLYCWECYCKWSFDQIIVAYKLLAEFVREKKVIVENNGVILSRFDVVDYGYKYVNDLKNRGYSSAPISGYFKEVKIIFDNQVTDPPNKPWLSFLDLITPRIETKLKDLGWILGQTTFQEDIFVVINNSCILFVEDSAGNKVFGK